MYHDNRVDFPTLEDCCWGLAWTFELGVPPLGKPFDAPAVAREAPKIDEIFKICNLLMPTLSLAAPGELGASCWIPYGLPAPVGSNYTADGVTCFVDVAPPDIYYCICILTVCDIEANKVFSSIPALGLAWTPPLKVPLRICSTLIFYSCLTACILEALWSSASILISPISSFCSSSKAFLS